jgi:hypothetical protein
MAVILLFAMVHYVAGYRLIYSLGILYAKEQAKECVAEKNANVKTLAFSTADYNSLKWTEHNKEFSLNNEMYDVVSTQKTGDIYDITVYSDDNESGWMASLHNCEKELFHPDQSTQGTKSAESVMADFQKDYIPVSEFKSALLSFATGLYQPIYAAQQRSLQVPDNIWHPPTC